jgi:hypothetical protein
MGGQVIRSAKLEGNVRATARVAREGKHILQGHATSI